MLPFMMRTPEVFLIAAEADIYVNGGANAMQYINQVRERAGAKALSGAATVETVLDERARELCGEYVRFYDLKRTGKLTSTYLKSTNPDVGQYFVDGKHEVRPFPQSFLENLEEGGGPVRNPKPEAPRQLLTVDMEYGERPAGQNSAWARCRGGGVWARPTLQHSGLWRSPLCGEAWSGRCHFLSCPGRG